MLTDILGVVEKTQTRPLLLGFMTLSMLIMGPKSELLRTPWSADVLMVPVCALMAYFLLFIWVRTIHRLNAMLPPEDLASGCWGPMIGSALLAVCLLFTFSYFANHPEGLTFAIAGKPGFIWLCTAFLLAAETAKIKRH